MFEIDKVTGSQLMRLWGVEEWPEVKGNYFLWNGVAVFVIRDFGDHVELHMAMKKEARRYCREAAKDILKVIGNREIWTITSEKRKHVCNINKKFGFVETWRGEAVMHGGHKERIILMKRRS